MHKILIFRVGQLGDSLVALPAIRAVQANYPGAKLSLLYDEHLGRSYVVSKALFEGSGLFVSYIGYPIGYSFLEKIKAFFALFRLSFRLRRSGYNLVVHLEPEVKTPLRSLRDRWFFRLSGIPRQIQTVSSRLSRVSDKPLPAIEHESDFFLRAIKAQGLQVPPPGQGSMCLGLGESESEEVRAWFESQPSILKLHPACFNPEPSVLYSLSAVGIGVGSKMQAKRWPLERFEALIRRLVEQYGIYPVYFGGLEDAAHARELIEKIGVGANACGGLSLRGAIRALEGCLFYVGNDTGTMHMAVAAGIRCIGIFSARDVPGKWYPYGNGHAVHRVPVECEGCMLQTCVTEERRCLTAISVEDVFASCAKFLN